MRRLTIAAHATLATLIALCVILAWPMPLWLLACDVIAIASQIIMIVAHVRAREVST
jgi:hypothetical protein